MRSPLRRGCNTGRLFRVVTDGPRTCTEWKCHKGQHIAAGDVHVIETVQWLEPRESKSHVTLPRRSRRRASVAVRASPADEPLP